MQACRAFIYRTAEQADAGKADRKDCAAVILYAAEAATRMALDAIQVRLIPPDTAIVPGMWYGVGVCASCCVSKLACGFTHFTLKLSICLLLARCCWCETRQERTRS